MGSLPEGSPEKLLGSPLFFLSWSPSPASDLIHPQNFPPPGLKRSCSVHCPLSPGIPPGRPQMPLLLGTATPTCPPLSHLPSHFWVPGEGAAGGEPGSRAGEGDPETMPGHGRSEPPATGAGPRRVLSLAVMGSSSKRTHGFWAQRPAPGCSLAALVRAPLPPTPCLSAPGTPPTSSPGPGRLHDFSPFLHRPPAPLRPALRPGCFQNQLCSNCLP